MSMLNITYKGRRTNDWVKESTKGIDIGLISNVNKLSYPGQGTSTVSKTTDGSRVSPLGDHATRTDARDNSQAVERRPRPILEGHDLAENSARQANLEAAF